MSDSGLFDYLNRFSAKVEIHKDEGGFEVRFCFPHGNYLEQIIKDLRGYNIDFADLTQVTKGGKC